MYLPIFTKLSLWAPEKADLLSVRPELYLKYQGSAQPA